MVSPEYLQEFRKRWNEVMSGNMGEKLKRILGIGGKTQYGNRKIGQKSNHIVSTVDENGFCIDETKVDEKSNETTTISELLDALNIKWYIIKTDVMG